MFEFFRNRFSPGGVTKVSERNPLPVTSSYQEPIAFEFSRPNDVLAYSDKMVVGNGSVLVFEKAARLLGGTGMVTKVRLSTNAVSNTMPHRLHLYRVPPTAIADRSPFALLWVNVPNRIGWIDIPALSTEGAGSNCATAHDAFLRMDYACAADDDKLYGVLASAGSGTPVANATYRLELTFRKD